MAAPAPETYVLVTPEPEPVARSRSPLRSAPSSTAWRSAFGCPQPTIAAAQLLSSLPRGHRVLAPSFAGSGSSWVRGLVEAATGVLTYTAEPTEVTIDQHIAAFRGQKWIFCNQTNAQKMHRANLGLIDQLCTSRPIRPRAPTEFAFVKSRFPGGECDHSVECTKQQFRQIGKVLLIVRNPWDVIHAHLQAKHHRMGSHQPLSPSSVLGAAERYRCWLEYWTNTLDAAAAAGVPVLVVHYEALCLTGHKVLGQIVQFLGHRAGNMSQAFEGLQCFKGLVGRARGKIKKAEWRQIEMMFQPLQERFIDKNGQIKQFEPQQAARGKY